MSQPEFRSTCLASRSARTPLLAFNVVDLASLLGILDASRTVRRPVIVQVSARTVSFYGADTIAAAFRAAVTDSGATAFLHLDHCADDTVLGNALRAGFDGIMADGSHLPFDENVSWTKRWADRGHDAGILVEGELGSIRGAEDGFLGGAGSETINGDSYRAFAESTGVDLLGADIGTAHGLYHDQPRIRFELLRELAETSGPGFVVHGCSGLTDETIRELVAAHAVKLNYSTDLKLAWSGAVRSVLEGNEIPEPLTALRAGRRATAAMAEERWQMLGESR